MAGRRSHRRGPRAESTRRRSAADDADGIVVGGPHAVRAVLEADDDSTARLVRHHALRLMVEGQGGGDLGGGRNGELVAMARRAGVAVEVVAAGECGRASGVRTQGIAAEIRYQYADFSEILQRAASGPAVLVFLDGIEDPHNLGAIIRTAEAAGVAAVILPGRRSAQVSAAVVRVSAGAAVHIPVCRVTNLVRALEMARDAGFWLIGLDQGAAEPLGAAATLGPEGCSRGLVVGGEGRGVRRLVGQTCDVLTSLPMRGRVESLNASVAAGVAIYRLCNVLPPAPGR